MLGFWVNARASNSNSRLSRDLLNSKNLRVPRHSILQFLCYIRIIRTDQTPYAFYQMIFQSSASVSLAVDTNGKVMLKDLGFFFTKILNLST